jgi:hypothetical protein
MDEQQYNDQLLASAVQFLIDGGEEKAAAILLSCTLRYQEHSDRHAIVPGWGYTTTVITLAAPRASYDVLTAMITEENEPLPSEEDEPELAEKVDLCASIRKAFQALTDTDVRFAVKASFVSITERWREELLALLRGDHVTNQGLPFAPERPVLTWNNLRFRSASEVRIAEALERARVLFLPNCMARLGFSRRENREADFLICHRGKWGILEVDGPVSHPASRKVDDDERARLFKAHGIRLVEHFDAGDWPGERGRGGETVSLSLGAVTRNRLSG